MLATVPLSAAIIALNALPNIPADAYFAVEIKYSEKFIKASATCGQIF